MAVERGDKKGMQKYHRKVISFSRRITKKITDNDKKLLTWAYGRILFNNDNIDEFTHFLSNLHHYNKVILEIGFGSGEHVAQLCAEEQPNPNSHNNDNTVIIACDPYINGAVKLLKKLQKKPLFSHFLHTSYEQSGNNDINSTQIGCIYGANGKKNTIINSKKDQKHIPKHIQLWNDDVNLILPHIANDVVDQFYVLCPDPWPKKRHHKRRLISLDTINTLLDMLKSDGSIVMTTDHDEYANYISDLLQENFANSPKCRVKNVILKTEEDCNAHRVSSRYALTALEGGNSIKYFEITKL